MTRLVWFGVALVCFAGSAWLWSIRESVIRLLDEWIPGQSKMQYYSIRANAYFPAAFLAVIGILALLSAVFGPGE